MSVTQSGGFGDAPRKVNFSWIGEAWNIFGQAALIWVVAVLVYGLIENGVQAGFKALFPNPGYVAPPNPFGQQYHIDFGVHYGTGNNSNLTPLGQMLSLLFLWVFGSFQNASLYRMAVKQVRREPVLLADAVGGGPVFAAMLVFNLFAALAALAGTLLLCVGVFFALALLLPGYALVADGADASSALSRSITAMKQDLLSGAGFVFVMGLVLLVSIVPCGLGLFVMVPMLHIVSALAYRDMIGMPGSTVSASGPDYGMAQPGVWPAPPTVPPPGA